MLIAKSVCFSLIVLSGMSVGAELETTANRKNDILGEHSLTLPAPIRRWDCALPLGNGLTGGLLWGEGNELRLSLDRGDLWDERGNEDVHSPDRNFQTLKATANKGGRSTWRRLFMNVYQNSPWTKLPGGRLVVKLPAGKQTETFQLDFQKATGTAKFADGTQADVFFSATDPIVLMRLPKGSSFELIRPDAVDSLGYPDPVFSKAENEVAYFQKTAEKLAYAVAVQWRDRGDHVLAVVAMTSNNEAKNPLELARDRIANGLKQGWDAPYAKHLAWWKDFYNTSSVTIPSPRIQHHYNLMKYLYGSGSRSHAPPMPLQGVWTADGGLPPWKGDYHNDLNTQMTYVAWQAAGLVDSGMSYINYYWDRLPQFRKYGKEFFGVDGPMVPGVMSLRGQAMGGWPQYGYMLTAGLWNGHAFYMHWKMTGDDEFMARRAYPWLAEITDALLSLAEEKDSQLKLPLSCSPEWNSEKFTAYIKPNSNFDQALLIWATEALEEMAAALGKQQDAEKWAAVRAKLGPLLFDEKTGALLVSEGVPLSHSHRHHSHTLAIHPLGILSMHQSDEARKAVRASVRQLIDLKPSHWTGYSHTWAAALAARAGFPDDAERCLLEFDRAYVTRNGFHVNSNQTNERARRQWRNFTLEGNFMLMDAVQEMCMQSHGGLLQIFPAIPASWQEAAFKDLRAEGAFKVSAKREGGATTEVNVAATRDSVLKLKDPFPGRKAKWNVTPERQGDRLLFKLKAGQVVRGTKN